MNSLKRITYEILHNDTEDKKLCHVLDDYLIQGLIILNVIAIILESFDGIYRGNEDLFHYLEVFSIIFFTVEYLTRLWIADIIYPENNPIVARLKYAFSPLGLVDLLAILPFYMPLLITLDLRFIRILRLLRLIRIFKIAHYSESVRLIGEVLKKKQRELLITLFGTTIIIMITSSLMYEIEHGIQPDKFPNILATFWWAIATLTTIGYGDVYPITGWGQTLAAITAIFGIGLVAIPTGILSAGFLQELEEKVERKRLEKEKQKLKSLEYCPYCGEKLPHT